MTTATPATVIGAVVPISGIGMMTIGTPARARAMLASVIGPSWASGATVQLIVEKTGRSATGAPPTAAIISSSGGDELGPAHLVLHVLGARAERDRLDLEVGRQRVEVAGRDRGPHVVDVGQGVEQAHDRAQVVGAALVALAGLVVEHVGRRAVGRETQAAVPQPHVVGRVAGGEQHLARRRLQAALDQLPRQPRR